MEDKRHFAEDFEQREQKNPQDWMRKLRREAWDRFLVLPFPTTHQEEWRFTNVAPILKTRFPIASEPLKKPNPTSLDNFHFGEALRLVFVDGHYVDRLSTVSGHEIKVRSLANLTDPSTDLEAHLGRYAAYEENVFTALNTALFQDLAFVEIPENVVLLQPLHLLFVSTVSQDAAFHPRILIVAGKGSNATVLESHVSLTDRRYFSNAVTEVVLEEGSVLHHLKLQDESRSGYHLSSIHVHQDRDSSYSSFLLTLGAELSRTDLKVRLDGVGTDCTLNGLYLISGNQHTDHHTTIDHLRPHGTSQELYKGILNGKSRAVFNGKIIVRKDAQKTDARQTNKNLLLSEGARINTKPQLEILADDVKCNHGAAIGHLEEEALFYLRSRGMSDSNARTLLMYGFVNDVSGRIQSEMVRAKVENILMKRLQEFAEVA